MKKLIPALLAVLLAACNIISAPDKVMYSDGFSDPESGWKVWAEDDSFVAYSDGTLRFMVSEPYLEVWSHPNKHYYDTLIFVTAELAGGTDDNHYGLICRYQDAGNYYAFLISSDGYAGILKMKDGQVEMLSEPTMEYQEVIRQGMAENDIAAGCVGNRLGLVVNGENIYEVEDGDFSEGDIGLMVGSHAEGGVDVRFDNLVVLRP